MKYSNVISAEFVCRPNRFIAEVMVGGERVRAHVKNTGRCAELLVPGAKVYVQDHRDSMGSRKLAYSLISVEKYLPDGRTIIVNMDSQAPNRVVKEALEEGRLRLPGLDSLEIIRPESRWGGSRLDFFLRDVQGREAYAEVKGVNLESEGVALFPDAPTDRGIRHLNELINIKESGRQAYVIFIIQMAGIRYLAPNDMRHRAFGEALRNAEAAGVKILAFDCEVQPVEIKIKSPVKTVLRRNGNGCE